MPLAKTDSQNRIRGLISTATRQRDDFQAAIAALSFADLGRGAGTLHKQGNVRLDMQGYTQDGRANIQVQIGSGTVAAVLVDAALFKIANAMNQRGATNAIISALNQSLDSGTIWNVTGKLP